MTFNSTSEEEIARLRIEYLEYHGAQYVSHRWEGGELIVSVIMPGDPPDGEPMKTFDVDIDVDIDIKETK